MKYTVFTPTYNRERDLGVLYNSLKTQTFTDTDFEWLIIDDGSTDNTKKIIEEFIREDQINIRYVKQKNGGKHRAFNRAIKEAKGEFVIVVDSDDYLKTSALQRVDNYSQIPQSVMALCFLCIDEKGKIIGDKFPETELVVNLIDLTYKYKVKGDKLWVFKSDVLKNYRFPEFKGEKFVTEGVLLFQMALKYDVFVLNEALQIHEYKDGGLTSIGNKRLFKDNPKGAKTYFKLLLKIAPNYKYRLFYLYNYFFYSVYRSKR